MGTTVKQPSPDPQIGEASKEAIQLGRDQFEAQQALVAQFSPLYQQQIEFQLGQQQKYSDRSDQSYADYDQYFRQTEHKLAETATNYDTADRRNQAAAGAEANVAGQFANARQSLTEDLSAQQAEGSGRGLALRNAMAIEEAKARAGAGDTARRNVESTGLSLMGNAANLGRGFPAQSTALGQAATGAGGAAQGSVAGLSGLTGAGYAQQLQGYGVGINGLLGQYQAQQQSTNASNGMFGDLLGAGLTAYGMYQSSKKVKDMGTEVSGKKALAGLRDLKVDNWTYKRGQGDEGSHVGPYAEDVQARFGDTVAPGGKAIDMVAMGKINADAIRELASQMDAMEKHVSELEAA
jgi:hypothetical protein